MWKTILRRVLFMIPQILILSVLIFMLAKMMPGDPFTGLINPNTDPAVIEKMRESAGLNDPWTTQYVRWIVNVFHGDFGESFIFKLPVSTLIGSRAINTILLSLVTVVIMYAIALPLGVLSGRYQNSILDKFVVIYNFFSFAVPPFIFALVMLFIFGYRLDWFPTTGSISSGVEPGTGAYIWDRFYHLILPALSQALLGTAITIQYLRNEVIDSQSLDYVRTARSKGVPTNKVYTRHIFRNASLPIVSQLSYEITALISGSVVIEKIFGYPGIGKLFIDSIGQRDYAVITALVLILGVATLVGNLISDIVMSLVDPRIRVQ
ncbi:peptide ABC transporter permease [Enterococcus sp. DIV0840]|uniref:Peptide ABC transporter permease n=1 Tax=Enterococcus haemoperoxidus ATCC BAA-382 TaxID=1158608 RepID=R2SWM4_9ENTE|nr:MULTISPECIES: oligopeptide ABC transporter permease [Enterococcus]EOH97206.1 peptide ABC transporter permease [Enterococcus haemoperoxidus ATCC BAA-382]EOT60019.1 peptide ABC transporter permease [Enterococcus haemoperoxidus ATCC BAA-382]MBO0434434.1 ABC transporter permease [Enterococcus sp. DIV0849a]MBO0473860.1 ABC transporter permease [Enterococcus ureasiticus]OJG56200.1 peptide ABC transporter permease [Enterococcus haemoperoxidus]